VTVPFPPPPATERSSVGLIVLAAGGSSRYGSPKQLVEIEGEPLVRRATRIARESLATQVAVVIGAYAADVRRQLGGLEVDIVEHAGWADGQASSLRAGLAHLRACEPAMIAAIVTLCDQPFVSCALLNALIEKHTTTGARIVASEYGPIGGLRGPPALFHRSLFAEIEMLTGDRGARQVLARHPAELAVVQFPEGVIDIDVPSRF
jgi:molybdenum cofactor cytidylyltransferase